MLIVYRLYVPSLMNHTRNFTFYTKLNASVVLTHFIHVYKSLYCIIIYITIIITYFAFVVC